VGDVLHLAERLVLTGGLQDEAAVAEDLTDRRPVVAHVGDLAERDHGDLARDDAHREHEAPVGADEPLAVPLVRLPQGAREHEQQQEDEDVAEAGVAGQSGVEDAEQ
jgi:hypothetical protein